MVGDRKINSSNIIGMLQTAYHFTKKEIYKEKADELMNEHGYLENLMRPMNAIGQAPDDADDWSKMLSDDGIIPMMKCILLATGDFIDYAFNDELKAKYRRQ